MRVGASEWSRRAASDIDGKTERSKWAGAHESMRATSEFSTQEKFVATLLCSVTAAQLDEVKAFYCRKICMF
jgi:hypothetical protein